MGGKNRTPLFPNRQAVQKLNLKMASCGQEEQKQEPLDTKRKARLLCGQFMIFERSVVYPPHKTQGDSFTRLFRLWFLASGYHSKQSISRKLTIYSMKPNFLNGRVLITYLCVFASCNKDPQQINIFFLFLPIIDICIV